MAVGVVPGGVSEKTEPMLGVPGVLEDEDLEGVLVLALGGTFTDMPCNLTITLSQTGLRFFFIFFHGGPAG